MKVGKILGVILAVAVALEGPVVGLARAQEAPAPAQTVEEEIHPLATVLTAVNIPARALLCGLASLVGSILMGASAGRRYADAAHMIEEGCSGPWIITPEMIEEGRHKQKEPGSATP